MVFYSKFYQTTEYSPFYVNCSNDKREFFSTRSKSSEIQSITSTLKCNHTINMCYYKRSLRLYVHLIFIDLMDIFIKIMLPNFVHTIPFHHHQMEETFCCFHCGIQIDQNLTIFFHNSDFIIRIFSDSFHGHNLDIAKNESFCNSTLGFFSHLFIYNLKSFIVQIPLNFHPSSSKLTYRFNELAHFTSSGSFMDIAKNYFHCFGWRVHSL